MMIEKGERVQVLSEGRKGGGGIYGRREDSDTNGIDLYKFIFFKSYSQ